MGSAYRPSSSWTPMLAVAGALALVLGLAPLTSGAQTPPGPSDSDVGTQAPAGQADTAQNADSPIAFERQAGATRYQTAAEIATARFEASTDVVVATGEDYADALAGAALEGDLGAPVLLVPSGLVNGSVPAAIPDAIDELGATTATLLGGERAISSDVADYIEANSTVVTTDRVEGATRFETAEEIATRVSATPVPTELSDQLGLGGDDVAFVATGLEFADALAAGAGAYEGPHPILLTGPDALHPAAARGLEASGADSAIILGGTDAVGGAVEAELNDAGYDTGRLAGLDRWATATEVADAFADGYGFGVADVGLATGFEFADALASAPYLGDVPAPLVLTPGNSVNDQPESWFAGRGCDIDTIHVFGGQVAVQVAVAEGYAETACPGDGEPDTLELTPESATNPHAGQLDGDDGQSHEVSATVTDATGGSADDVDVLFEVYEDTATGDAAVLQPVGETAVVSTDVDGVAQWSYDGPDSERTDLIVACTPEGSAASCTDGPNLLRDAGSGELTNLQHDPGDTAEKAWVARELQTLQIQPETAVNDLGDPHEVTAIGQDQFGDASLDEWDGTDGDRVVFEVYEGSEGAFADTGDGAHVDVDGDGEAVHSYTGPNADRDDLIVACLVGADETIGDVDCAELDGGDLTIDNDRLTATAEKAWRELISLSADPVELEAGGGEHSVITATVTDASGDPVEGVDVEFTNNGDGDFVEGATVTEATDADGEVTVVYETAASDDGQIIEVTGTEQLNGGSDTATAGVGAEIASASGNASLDQVEVTYTADISFGLPSSDFLDQFTYTDADGNEATPTILGGSAGDTITLNFAAGVVEAADDGDADLEYVEGAEPVEADTSGVNVRTPDGVTDMPVS